MAENASAAARAVDRFQEAKAELLAFLGDQEIRELLQELEQLVTTHNESLDRAVRAVKLELRGSDHDKLIIHEIGAQKKYKRWYDTDFLAKSLPASQYDLCMTEKITHELDITRLEQLSRQGEIDNELVTMAYREEEQNPASLPGTPKPYTLPSLPVLDG